jgi:hypothetical protein
MYRCVMIYVVDVIDIVISFVIYIYDVMYSIVFGDRLVIRAGKLCYGVPSTGEICIITTPAWRRQHRVLGRGTRTPRFQLSQQLDTEVIDVCVDGHSHEEVSLFLTPLLNALDNSVEVSTRELCELTTAAVHEHVHGSVHVMRADFSTMVFEVGVVVVL